jgi:hypothetical protein
VCDGSESVGMCGDVLHEDGCKEHFILGGVYAAAACIRCCNITVANVQWILLYSPRLKLRVQLALL